MNLNWQLIAPSQDNGMNALMEGYQLGQHMRQQRKADEREQQERQKEAARGDVYRALLNKSSGNGIVATPDQQAETERLERMFPNAPQVNDDFEYQSALKVLAKYDPEAAYKLAQGQREQADASKEQERNQIKQLAGLLDDSTDEASYQRNIQIAQRMGLDIGDAPPTFDPEWIATEKRIVEAFVKEPQKLTAFMQEAEALGMTPEQTKQAWLQKYDPWKTVPYQQGGGVAAWNPVTGEKQVIVQPNAGEAQPQQFSDGMTATNPQTGEKVTFKNGQWVPVGGAVSNGGGNFPVGQ